METKCGTYIVRTDIYIYMCDLQKFSHFISNISHSKVSRRSPPQDPPMKKLKKDSQKLET